MFTHGFVVLQRITIPEILEGEWFRKGFKPPAFEQDEEINLDDVDAVFSDSKVHCFHVCIDGISNLTSSAVCTA